MNYETFREMLFNRESIERIPFQDRSVPRLIVECLEDPDWIVRGNAAALIVGGIVDGHPGYRWDVAIPSLVAALKDEHSELRRNAAEALGEIGRHPEYDMRDAIVALIEALKDSGREVRAHAAMALGQAGDSSAVPALIAALNDEYQSVRYRAAGALADIAGKNEIDLDSVKTALRGFVERVRREGSSDETRSAEKEAAGYLVWITNAAAKFRAKSQLEEGVILEGAPKPPAGQKMFRERRPVFA